MSSWPEVFQLGGAVAIATGTLRVLWGMERNVVRGYAERIAELEKRLKRAEEETDEWRARYERAFTRRVNDTPSPPP